MSEILINNELEFRMNHYFSDGVYIREITMPGGCFVQGKRHKTKHLNIILYGRVMVYDTLTHEIKLIEGPCTFESEADCAKTLYVHEETVWQTVHVNVNNEKNLEQLEAKLVYPDLDNATEMIAEFQKVLNGEEVLCLG
jgi:hypothetical protein